MRLSEYDPADRARQGMPAAEDMVREAQARDDRAEAPGVVVGVDLDAGLDARNVGRPKLDPWQARRSWREPGAQRAAHDARVRVVREILEDLHGGDQSADAEMIIRALEGLEKGGSTP